MQNNERSKNSEMWHRLPSIESVYMLIHQGFEQTDSHVDPSYAPKFDFRIYSSQIQKRIYKTYEKEIAGAQSENDKMDHSDVSSSDQPKNTKSNT